ncbi:MAG: CPBP family intramembrane metalloprotease [Phycisphaerales bacterium]|nr:CPBP family intramembrane metalloprotease [Phycisphaerales bacterium]
MNIDQLIAQAPFIACWALTLCAFAAAGAWRARRQAARSHDSRSAVSRIATPLVVGVTLVAATLLLVPRAPLPEDAAVPTAAYGARGALIQLATNAALAAPFVAWVVWRRQGLGALGIGKEDALRSLAIGACVSLVCIAMLGRLSVPFWSTPGTWWQLLAMLGVGASEEIVFRGFVLGGLAKRMPRLWAELGSAVLFSLVHVPQRIASGMAPGEIAVSLVVLLAFGWCCAAAMRYGKNVPGLALVHAVFNVCAVG